MAIYAADKNTEHIVQKGIEANRKAKKHARIKARKRTRVVRKRKERQHVTKKTTNTET